MSDQGRWLKSIIAKDFSKPPLLLLLLSGRTQLCWDLDLHTRSMQLNLWHFFNLFLVYFTCVRIPFPLLDGGDPFG